MISRYPGTCCRCARDIAALNGVISGAPLRRYCLPCAAPEIVAEVDAKMRAWRGRGLFAYQRAGASWLAARRRGLLADDQGLGKTVQALAAHPLGAPLVIVCPAVAKEVWREHIAQLRPDIDPYTIYGRGCWQPPAPATAAIINYEILEDDPGQLAAGTTAVFDEAHYAKNEAALRHTRAAALAAQAARVYLLTGTPLKSRPPDLLGVLEVAGLADEAFGEEGFSHYFPHTLIRVRGSRFPAWGRPREGVADALRRVMLRRLKSDVLADLPPKRWDTLPVVLDPAAAAAVQAYELALGDLGFDLADLTAEVLEAAQQNGEALPAREEFSRACAELARVKLAAVIAEVEAHEREHPDDPLIVWSRHVDPLKALGSRPGWGTIHGSVGAARRADLIQRFQAGEMRGLALSITAAGTAITLTRADRAIFLDRSWAPADNVQAEDRIHRIGQSRPCRYTDLVADHALDRHLHAVLMDKKEAIEASIDAAATR